ncbi:hypothetical protein N9I19_18280 [Peribacillus sp. CSMR9]|nr:hypothetical protein [Peribacillus sp. CSMR9]
MANEAVSNIGMLKDGAVLKVDFLKIDYPHSGSDIRSISEFFIKQTLTSKRNSFRVDV